MIGQQQEQLNMYELEMRQMKEQVTLAKAK